MTIITSQPPYRDDFDETKGYYRILYRPGFPVQARELTQSQTAIQNQIAKFGRHIFKEGSIVTGGQFDIDLNFPYVLLTTSNQVGNSTDPLSFAGEILVSSSGVKAQVIKVERVINSGTVYYPAFVRYISGSTSGNISEFVSGEVLSTTQSSINTIRVRTETFGGIPVTGKGSLFTIQSGTIFSNDLFIDFAGDSIVLESFSRTPTCRIGFTIRSEIIGEGDDDSLLDQANGTPNYNAPGAHRLKITPVLTKLDTDDVLSLPTFIELFTVKDGVLLEKYERPLYAIIGDEIAKRTYDESGDYVVRGMNALIREHLDTGINEGYLTSENGGDSNKLAIGIEPGLAYVKGYEINKLVSEYIPTEKSTDSIFVNSQPISARSGNYVLIEEIVGQPILDKGTVVTFYDAAEDRISLEVSSNSTPSGNAIGTAKVKSLIKESGVLGTANARMRLYLYDINISTVGKTLSDARSVFVSNGTASFFADIVLLIDSSISPNIEKVFLYDTLNTPLIYPIGSNFVKNIRSSDNTSDTIFVFQRTSSVSIDSTGNFGVSINTPLESFEYGLGTLTSIDKGSLFLSLNEERLIELPGTVSGSHGGNTLSGTNTFFTRLNVGDHIAIGDSPVVTTETGVMTIASIIDDDTLTIEETFDNSGNPFSTQPLYKVYKIGSIIDLSTKGSADGVERSVQVDSSTTMTFDLHEDFETSISATISYLVSRGTAYEIKKTLNSNRYVQINCGTVGDLTGPLNLGFSDVFRIKSIRKKEGSSFTTVSEGSDITTFFHFNNGQKDDVYDHASITASASAELTSNDYLLVKLDHFVPSYSQGVGYFSIDSYPIDDSEVSDSTIFTHEIPVYKSSFGNVYDLRNHLDFRPIKSSTANSVTSLSGITTNPSASSGFNYDSSGGLRTPYPSSNIYVDYSYYLARRDVVTLDKDGKFGITKGISAIYPVTPSISENLMGIAKIYIPPYPSLSTAYARILSRNDLACKLDKITFARHTMRDIGVLKERINNLEYYNSVTLLEKSATDMLILDENGLDRFKNGFFVDGFLDHSLGATYNSDYKIVIDPKEQSIRPMFKMDSFDYEYKENESINVVKTGNLIILPYTETVFLEQLKATSYRNIEQSVFRFIGTMEISPDTDNWVDTTTVDLRVDQDFSVDYPASLLETKWGSWQDTITGYSVYDRAVDDRSGIIKPGAKYYGTFSTYAEAVAAGKRLDGDGRFLIETVTTSEREGVSYNPTNITDTQELGSFVTDASLATYIRPQIITIFAKGLKAKTRFHVYFDGENMNEYSTPISTETTINDVEYDSDSIFASLAAPPPYLSGIFGVEGTSIISDEYGEVIVLLRLPSEGKRFRVGTKEVKLTDSPTNAIDATSYSIGYFVGQGLIQKKQNTILSTKNTVLIPDFENESKTKQKTEIYGPSCMAYSFYVQAPEGEDGVFLTSVDVWIQALDEDLGVWFEIREMNSAGGITRTQVPYSEVWMKRSDPRLKIASYDDLRPAPIETYTATNVNFSSPVFLMNNTQYAFVIHTEGLNPNTYFYVSRIGETDIFSGVQVTSRQLTGNVYTTNNNLNWDIVPDIDLKIRFNRASFDTSVTGIVSMGNLPWEFFSITDKSNLFSIIGEEIRGTQQIVLSSILGNDTIAIGDTIVSSTESAEVIDIDSDNFIYYTDGILFEESQEITVTGKDTTATISSVDFGSGILISFDRKMDSIKLKNSNGKFFNGGPIRGMLSGTTATISPSVDSPYSIGINDLEYSTICYNPNYIIFTNTSCDFSIKGTTNNILGEFISIIPNTNYDLDSPYSLLSRSNEISYLSGDSSVQSKILMNTTSNWVSPILDVSRNSTILVTNFINDDITNEDAPSGGNLLNKYISKTVTLAEGQDAEDLLVSLTAYCPPGITDLYPVKVWMKIWNSEDSGIQFAERPWVELEKSSTNVYSSLSNKNDFKSFDFKIPSSMMNGPYGEVQYSSGGNNYNGFKQFAVKVGLLGTNSAILPRVADLRAIALQM